MNEQENHISNNSMSEDQKEIQTEIKNDKKPDIETPKKNMIIVVQFFKN